MVDLRDLSIHVGIILWKFSKNVIIFEMMIMLDGHLSTAVFGPYSKISGTRLGCRYQPSILNANMQPDISPPR